MAGPEDKCKNVLRDYPDYSDYNFKRSEETVFTFEEIATNEKAMLDTRFKANYDEGHIPGCTLMPFNMFMNADGSFKDHEDIKELLQVVGGMENPVEQPVVTTCMKGYSAAVTYLALKEIGNKDVKLYDGSYSEYSTRA